MKLKLTKLAIIALTICLIGCSQTNAIEVGQEAPDFTLNSLDGKATRLSDFKGRVVILDFFASWCPPCREEIPDFIELEKSYGDKGFSMVGVSLTDLRDSEAFAAKAGINYPILIDDEKASTLYGPIRSIPTTFVIDKDSKIRKIYIGYKSKDVFENDIKELLK